MKRFYCHPKNPEEAKINNFARICRDLSQPAYIRKDGNHVYIDMMHVKDEVMGQRRGCSWHWEFDASGTLVRWRVESDDFGKSNCEGLVPAGHRLSPWFTLEGPEPAVDETEYTPPALMKSAP